MQTPIQKEQMDYFWKKKEIVSFLLCILVFLIHISSFGQYRSAGGDVALLNEKLEFFFKESITRFAVPMYFILSGITFFRDYSNQKYVSKIKSRFFTLLIPYLIWNTLCMLFDVACSYSFLSSYLAGRKLFELTVENVLKGIFFYGNNIPFWYLFYLIIFVMLSPVFDMLVRNKRVGIVSIVILSMLSVFEPGIDYGLNYEAIVFYLIGAFLGKHYFETVTRKTSRTSGILSAAFLLVYIFAKNLFPASEYYCKPFVTILVFALAAYSVWSMTDMVMGKISYRTIYSRSFPIFAMHTNVSAVVCKIIYLIFPRNGYFALPNLLLTLGVTIIIINVCSSILERYTPSLYALLMGKGIKNKRN